MPQQNIARTNTDDSFWHKQWKEMTIDFFQLNSLHPMLTKHINLLLENREKVRFFFFMWEVLTLLFLLHNINKYHSFY